MSVLLRPDFPAPPKSSIERYEASYARARQACEAEVERINAAWRNRTPEEKAAYDTWQMLRALRVSDEQYDIEREADQQGVTVADLMRPARQGGGSSGDRL